MDELAKKKSELRNAWRSRRDAVGADERALVPGIVFDRYGSRLGYGSGCYDRFLPAFKHLGGVSAGLARMDQISDVQLPCLPFDVPVDAIITENDVIRPA